MILKLLVKWILKTLNNLFILSLGLRKERLPLSV